MIRILVSKPKYIELINKELQKQAQHRPCMQIKAVPAHINPRGYVPTDSTPLSKKILELAIAEVEKKYYYEQN